MATAQDVRRLALALPRAYEALVRDYVKFRVGRIVFLSISPGLVAWARTKFQRQG